MYIQLAFLFLALVFGTTTLTVFEVDTAGTSKVQVCLDETNRCYVSTFDPKASRWTPPQLIQSSDNHGVDTTPRQTGSMNDRWEHIDHNSLGNLQPSFLDGNHYSSTEQQSQNGNSTPMFIVDTPQSREQPQVQPSHSSAEQQLQDGNGTPMFIVDTPQSHEQPQMQPNHPILKESELLPESKQNDCAKDKKTEDVKKSTTGKKTVKKCKAKNSGLSIHLTGWLMVLLSQLILFD